MSNENPIHILYRPSYRDSKVEQPRQTLLIKQVLAVEGTLEWDRYMNKIKQTFTFDSLKDERIFDRWGMDKGSGRVIFGLKNGDLKVANPLMSRLINIYPQIGEWVKIISYEQDFSKNFFLICMPNFKSLYESSRSNFIAAIKMKSLLI